MSVEVDDARHQGEPAGVDDFGGIRTDLADRGNALVLDGEIGASRVVAETVDQRRTPDHEIVHPALLYAAPNGIRGHSKGLEPVQLSVAFRGGSRRSGCQPSSAGPSWHDLIGPDGSPHALNQSFARYA